MDTCKIIESRVLQVIIVGLFISLVSGVDLNLEGHTQIAFECSEKGHSFQPNSETTCVCTTIFQAKCHKVQSQSSTASIPLEKNQVYHYQDQGQQAEVPKVRSLSVPPVNPAEHQNPPEIASPYQHPLDPLTPAEIERSREIISKTLRPERLAYFKFNAIYLQEPRKAALVSYYVKNKDPPKGTVKRRSYSLLIEEGTGVLYEALVDLDQGVLESFTPASKGARPLATVDTAIIINDVVKGDAEVARRCAGLGYKDMNLVVPEAMVVHHLNEKDEYRNLTRPYQVFMYGMKFPGDNYYAHPFDFIVFVDEAARTVMGIKELPAHDTFDYGATKKGNTVPDASANYNTNYAIKGDKPIKTVMPEGASYKVEGNKITWQKFSMRIGFNQREGLILHHVGYTDDEGQFRPIMYRGSLSEVATYYADPRPPFHRKYAYDEGNIGFGFATTPLVDQLDCLGSTHFFSTTTNNATGHPVTIPSGICVFEDDAGILWKHAPNRYSNDHNYVVRSHRLNIMTSANFGNYDYIITWSFHQDAMITLKTQLTGIVSTSMVAVNATPAGFGTLVAPQVNAQYHQHVFAVRLDLDIDGVRNSVHSTEAAPLSAKSGSELHPLGNGFGVHKHHFRKQSEGCSKINPFTGRSYVITNPGKIHPYTKSEIGWKLMPVVDPEIMMKAESPVYDQMGFLQCDTWITRYEEGELFAGGYWLNGSGLPEWVVRRGEESIEDQDIVLWHMFSPVHIPRVEDYPVMPVESRELMLKPYNFFLKNPALS